MTRNLARGGLLGLATLIGLLLSLAVSATANAGTPAPDDTQPDSVPLVPVPEGCPSPDPAEVVFVGTVVGADDVTQTIRFRIDQLRAGSAGPFAIDGLIDVRYGSDYRFLVVDEQYLIGAAVDPTYGVLASAVRPQEPNFGGNDVVGVNDSSIECVTIDDPVRTLNVDGTGVDSGVLSLLFEDQRLLLATLAVPTALAFATLLALAVLKVFGALAMRGVFELGRTAVTPVPDHRAVRIRSHRSGSE